MLPLAVYKGYRTLEDALAAYGRCAERGALCVLDDVNEALTALVENPGMCRIRSWTKQAHTFVSDNLHRARDVPLASPLPRYMRRTDVEAQDARAIVVFQGLRTGVFLDW